MIVHRTDPYAALGLTQHATQGQIRRAYRSLLRQNHPDTRVRGNLADNAASDRRLQQVIAAYAILSDQARRADHEHPTSPRQTRIPPRVHPGMPFADNAPDQPPIKVGPVRWHGSRS
jgi:curved DNA-binding protein CbpA